MTEDLTQNGDTNGQEVETHSQQKGEEEEDTYQKEENVFTADEGILETLHNEEGNKNLFQM